MTDVNTINGVSAPLGRDTARRIPRMNPTTNAIVGSNARSSVAVPSRRTTRSSRGSTNRWLSNQKLA